MNYILTHYTGDLNQPGLQAFVHSTRLVDAQVIFFTTNTEIPEGIRADHVRYVITKPWHWPHIQRHFDWLNLIREEDLQGKFFICDSRDLVFMGDPFKSLTGGSHYVHVFQECALYRNRDEYYNAWWMDCMRQGALDEMGDLPILCGGTIFGETRQAIERYLVAHTELLTQYIPTMGQIFSDQSSFCECIRQRMAGDPNLIIHKNEMPSLVYTMGNVPEGEYTVEGHRVQVNGYLPTVIHQFDRRFPAFRLISDLYPFWPQFPS